VIKSSRKRWPLFRFLDKQMIERFVLPTRLMIGAVLAGTLFIPLGQVTGLGYAIFWTYLMLLLVFSIIDLLLLPRRSQLEAVRELPKRAELGQPLEVAIRLRNRGSRLINVLVADDMPDVFTAEPILLAVLVQDGEQRIMAYKAAGTARGTYAFSFLDIRYWGRWGFWTKQVRITQEQMIRIYPDLSNVKGLLSSVQDSLLLDGKKVYKKQKVGSEFTHIREYTTDDDPRHMNWAAAARTGRLMTNVFEPERGKIVTLLLDCGRMMGVELDKQVKLDRSLEAAMTLAAIALKQGDQVAVLAFSGTVKAYVPAGRGMAHLQVILEAVFDLRHDAAESNFGIALEYLQRSQRRRSLIVLFSDMENYLFAEQLYPYIKRLRAAHLLLLLSLQDPLLHAWTRAVISDSRAAYIRSTAQKFALDRKQYTQKMAAIGIQVLDVPADQLAVTAVNYYLDVKAREAL
jgi:uncharacterized protein (DUF58 family)